MTRLGLIFAWLLALIVTAHAGSGSGWNAEVVAVNTNGAAKSRPQRPPVTTTGALPTTGKRHDLDGIGSYYWQGETTASGEPFRPGGMTAAHKTLPFGSHVKVTNLGNGKSAVVRINDRGPFVPGRVIDVSEAAAEVLGMKGRGLAPVRIEVVER